MQYRALGSLHANSSLILTLMKHVPALHLAFDSNRNLDMMHLLKKKGRNRDSCRSVPWPGRPSLLGSTLVLTFAAEAINHQGSPLCELRASWRNEGGSGTQPFELPVEARVDFESANRHVMA